MGRGGGENNKRGGGFVVRPHGRGKKKGVVAGLGGEGKKNRGGGGLLF